MWNISQSLRKNTVRTVQKTGSYRVVYVPDLYPQNRHIIFSFVVQALPPLLP